MYKIGIVGAGYVGLTTGLCFTHKDGGSHSVVFYDTDNKKIDMIKSGKVPFYEPGLEGMLHSGVDRSLVRPTTEISDLINCDVIFICVGTPSNGNGSIDLNYVKEASRNIGGLIRNSSRYQLIVVKSTVIPGSTESVVIPAISDSSEKTYGSDFGVSMNPEFLTEGNAVKDGLYPSRIVIGSDDQCSADSLVSLYEPWGSRTNIVVTDVRTAEMIKYASNAMLAARLGLANELARYCSSLGISSRNVMSVVGLDPRIGPQYLGTSRGWGGSCFPKDLASLVHLGEQLNIDNPILRAVIESNETQKIIMVDQLEKSLGTLDRMVIAVLGLAFKRDTDDIRHSPAIDIIRELRNRRALVRAYDPKAMDDMVKWFSGKDIYYASSTRDALTGADGCLLVTDWPQFADLTDEDFGFMRRRITKPPNIIEGLPILNSKRVSGYKGISW